MKKSKTNINYFAEKEEQAVIDYIMSNSAEEKNRIYNEILVHPFRIMKQSIIRRYPIHIGDYDMEEVESNALTHLIENMVKYRPYIIYFRNKNSNDNDKWIKFDYSGRFFIISDANKKINELMIQNSENEYVIIESKAFSYCQTIIRNYYKDHSKKSYLEKKINMPFDDYFDEINQNFEYTYEIELESQYQLEMLINNINIKIKKMIDNNSAMKKNEIIVGDAIINILNNWHILFMEETPEGNYNKRVTNKFEKNKILLYLKEQTGLSTKEIRMGIKPFKELYFLEKLDFLNE